MKKFSIDWNQLEKTLRRKSWNMHHIALYGAIIWTLYWNVYNHDLFMAIWYNFVGSPHSSKLVNSRAILVDNKENLNLLRIHKENFGLFSSIHTKLRLESLVLTKISLIFTRENGFLISSKNYLLESLSFFLICQYISEAILRLLVLNSSS